MMDRIIELAHMKSLRLIDICSGRESKTDLTKALVASEKRKDNERRI